MAKKVTREEEHTVKLVELRDDENIYIEASIDGKTLKAEMSKSLMNEMRNVHDVDAVKDMTKAILKEVFKMVIIEGRD